MRDQSKITSIARGLTEWADRPANARFLGTEQQRVLEEHGDGPQAPVAAWMLGTWRLGHGFARVLRGEVRGFDEARTGQALRRCSLLLRDRSRQHDRRQATDLPFSVPQLAMTALLGLALGDPGGEPVYDALTALPDRAFQGQDELALFARELVRLRNGQRGTIPPQLGEYREVLLHWQGDDHVLALRLAAMLDRHLRGVDRPGSLFEDPSSRLYPVEALAVQNVRRWLELKTPKIDHALMFTNLATMRPKEGWPQDPLVRQLERRTRRR